MLGLADPMLSKLYHHSQFPEEFWSPSKLKSYPVFNKLNTDTDYAFRDNCSEQYCPLLWSMFKIDQNQKVEKII